jgi:hypothetical protein
MTKITLLMAVVLLAATPAGAGFVDCKGTVTLNSKVDPEIVWVAIEEGSLVCMMYPAGSAGSREFVKKCPLGSKCSVKYDSREREHVKRVK